MASLNRLYPPCNTRWIQCIKYSFLTTYYAYATHYENKGEHTSMHGLFWGAVGWPTIGSRGPWSPLIQPSGDHWISGCRNEGKRSYSETNLSPNIFSHHFFLSQSSDHILLRRWDRVTAEVNHRFAPFYDFPNCGSIYTNPVTNLLGLKLQTHKKKTPSAWGRHSMAHLQVIDH